MDLKSLERVAQLIKDLARYPQSQPNQAELGPETGAQPFDRTASTFTWLLMGATWAGLAGVTQTQPEVWARLD